ncbi:hypothetical protein [Arenibaculum pallidiluteum]|uniref:hypothetical protein n=1 Tax=Arenibaculum pallidiluteum TaxID=2812559 RepID=UPI001A97A5C1|nr:hypothetical protein [Arenibaculum pallidiluteum]
MDAPSGESVPANSAAGEARVLTAGEARVLTAGEARSSTASEARTRDAAPGGVVISLAARRAARRAEERRLREEAFDRELRRRMDLFLAGLPIPSTPITDNPYL